jgi:hypothetical protein
MFHACDTIINYNFKKIIKYKKDCVVLSKDNLNQKDYRSFLVNKKNNYVIKVLDKDINLASNQERYNYTGVCFIYNFVAFKKHLKVIKIDLGEVDYFEKNNKFYTKYIFANNWYDIGNVISYNKTLKKFSNFKNLDKKNQFIYFVKNNVIKFNRDKKVIKNLFIRSKYLYNFAPLKIEKRNNFLKYKYSKGFTLSSNQNFLLGNFKKFLDVYKKFFIIDNVSKKLISITDIKYFYYFKTLSRLESFYKNNNFVDKIEFINNTKIRPLNLILKLIDWNNIFNIYPIKFHGDLHFENIIFYKNKFTLIDWRDSFGNSIKYGDLYYDLGKLMHGIIVNHNVIKSNNYFFQLKDNKVNIGIKFMNTNLFLNYFDEWIEKNNFDKLKVRNITSLIFLNISPLHHYPYNFFLYYLARFLLDDFNNLNKLQKF